MTLTDWPGPERRGLPRPAAASPGADVSSLARRLARIQRLSGVGEWEWEISSGALTWSPEIYSIFGLSPQEIDPTYQLFLAHVHPEDRAEVELQVDRAVAGLQPYDVRHRIVRPGGEVRLVHQQGEVERDAEGRAALMFGAVRDVTRQAPATGVRRAEEMLAAMLRISPEAILLCDARGRISAFSAGAETMFGYESGEIVGQRVEQLMPERFRSGHARYVEAFSAGGSASLRMHERAEIMGLRRNGEVFPAEASLAKLEAADGFSLVTIVRDLSERRATEASLIDAREQAEQANAAKSIFLANMSHEIRTPLNGVLGVAGALARTELSPRQREMVGLIEVSGRALQGLLGDILDLAKIDAGRMQLRMAPFALDRLLEETAALFRASAVERGVTLALSVDRAVATTYIGDELRIRQVLSNLISNAVKFTVRGRIEVGVRLLPGPSPETCQAVFQVRDTGVGFEPELAERLFERFEQADGSVTRNFGGTGLGLAISKALVELMGGVIRAEGRPGRGATFEFSIPLEHDVVGAPAPPPPSACRTEAETVQVLLAEDHPINRMAVEYILESLPVDLTSVADGLQAAQAARDRRYDLILMDMQMPVMDGLSAIRLIREDEAARGLTRTRICMLTANAFDEHRERAAAAGADGFLTKPVQIDQLLGLVSEIANASTAL